MTVQELYKAIGVAGYEALACWRKEGVFHLRLSPPSSCHNSLLKNHVCFRNARVPVRKNFFQASAV